MKINFEHNFYFLIPILFVFPLMKENIISFFIILLSLNTILFALKTKKILINKEILLFTIPFWIVLIVSIFNFKTLTDLKPINNVLLFLIFPIVFFNIPKIFFTTEKLNLYFEILKYTLLIIALTYYFSFFYFYDFKDIFTSKYNIPKFRDFIYNEIPFFKIHPTYYTSILIFSIANSLDKLIKKRVKTELFFILFFSLTILIFLSKFNIFYLFVLFAIVLYFKTKIKFYNKVIISIFIVIFSITLVSIIPGIKNRFEEMITSYKNPPKGMEYDSTNIRVSIVKCSVSIAKENLWLGVGFNKIEQKLLNCYKENYDSNFYVGKKYLTHNYFMYILIGGGMFSFLFYLFYLYRIYLEIKFINSFLLSISMLNIFLLNFTEDFLFRQKGLFYFSLIFFTFLMHQKQTNNLE